MEEIKKGGSTPEKAEESKMDWFDERSRIYTFHRLKGLSEEKADAMALAEVQKRAEKAGYPRERIYGRKETDTEIKEANKKAIERSAREVNNKDFSKRIAEHAEEIGFAGYEDMISEGKALFLSDLEGL